VDLLKSIAEAVLNVLKSIADEDNPVDSSIVSTGINDR
jgi:hypothetical protein